MYSLLKSILDRVDAGLAFVLCTVVRTRGSTPQKAGAMLAVLATGETLGTIGGGCVEAEIRSRALKLLADPAANDVQPLATFQLDHDFGWDDGLVCGGTMHVAIERFDSLADARELLVAADRLSAGEAAQISAHAISPEGKPVQFERTLEPTPRLVIAGAGHVGVALADLARNLDFDVTVIDDRPDLASPERFPEAHIRIGVIEDELATIATNDSTYIVIVTRGHRHDGRALSAAIQRPARYVGLIGSKRKIITILADLRDAGIPEAQLRRVHAPIGLDIGAVTPGEIAVSIAAELIAVRRQATNCPASPMRLTESQMSAAIARPPA